MVNNTENKVYYGEYSLKHWIEMLLKQEIILPPYQRNFVWTESQRAELIKSLKKQQFVPPVIIGSFIKKENNKQNLIIDGQQRLTSILLSVLGYFPDRDKYKKDYKPFIDEHDRVDPDEQPENVIDWQFDKLIEKSDATITGLQKILEKNEYFKKIDESIDEEFLSKTFLGFSYLIPNNSSKEAQQNYYSSVFRNINAQGQKLLAIESRASLYYLDENKKSLFSPDFIETGFETGEKLDFVRYLAILSHYAKNPHNQLLCKGYGNRLEDFYELYIDTIVTNKPNDWFISYSDLFNESHEEKLRLVESAIANLELFKLKLNSIIETDLYFFGAIYLSLFKEDNLASLKLDKLKEKIKVRASLYRQPYIKDQLGNDVANYHQRNPSALKFITQRVKDSIEIYEEALG
jgi:hypothetical protein BACCOPRO_01637